MLEGDVTQHVVSGLAYVVPENDVIANTKGTFYSVDEEPSLTVTKQWIPSKMVEHSDVQPEFPVKLRPSKDHYDLKELVDIAQLVFGKSFSSKVSKEANKDILRILKIMVDLRSSRPPFDLLKVQFELGREIILWDDLDTIYNYEIIDLPMFNVDEGTVVPLQISRFENFDTLEGVISFPWLLEMREALCKQLKRYCRRIPNDVNYRPFRFDVLFVRIPTEAEIDDLLFVDLDENQSQVNAWKNDTDVYTDIRNQDFFNLHAHKWTRAVFIQYVNAEKALEDCYGLLCNLVDFGVRVPVHRYYTRKSVYRYLPCPVLAVNAVILIQGMSMGQYTTALNEKWKKLLIQGSVYEFRCVLEYGDRFIVFNFANPTQLEVHFEDAFKKMVDEGKEVDNSHLPDHMYNYDTASQIKFREAYPIYVVAPGRVRSWTDSTKEIEDGKVKLPLELSCSLKSLLKDNCRDAKLGETEKEYILASVAKSYVRTRRQL